MYWHLLDLAKPTEKSKILDMGVTPNTSLIESNYFEKMYPFTNNITMSSIEDASNLEEIFKGATFVKYTANERFPFDDKQFDILFCSAVLEHVGHDEDQRYFINECLRVAKKIYLTTPNKYFPVEFHTYLPFVHFLPQQIQKKILRKIKLDFWAETSNLNLLTRKKLYSMIPEEIRNRAMIYYNRLFGVATNLILFVDE
jgi:ubiquinone/menaquinone biosynthesis C-methylase UbiE